MKRTSPLSLKEETEKFLDEIEIIYTIKKQIANAERVLNAEFAKEIFRVYDDVHRGKNFISPEAEEKGRFQ